MTIDDIIQTRARLERELRLALSTMERKEAIRNIRLEIIDNQKHCPHASSKYNWEIADGVCPYCGCQLDWEGERRW